MSEVIFIFAAMAIVAAFAVESSSWWIKSAAGPGTIGLYVSRSNIYLYFGRFFALAYNALIAFGIENGASARNVAAALACGFAGTAILHSILLRGSRATHLTIAATARLLLLPAPAPMPASRRPSPQRGLVLATAFASACFALGISLPLLLAVFVPQYRMSLSYIGQTVNAAGTLMLLFMVDQQLFRALDKGRLFETLPSYNLGRTIAFVVAALVCTVVYGYV